MDCAMQPIHIKHSLETAKVNQNSNDHVLEIRDLEVVFDVEGGAVKAVNGVSLNLRRGKITAVVGESGCGKSVTSYSIMRLIQKPGRIAKGSITFNPEQGSAVDMVSLSEKDEQLYALRGGSLAMIFQEPMTALSPVYTVGNQICEAILLHQSVSEQEAKDLTIKMLAKVGIPAPEKRFDQYPFELSGGMRQRIVIAMALVCNPELLIADEPTTALDVTIQAQVLRLMKKLQEDLGTSILMITHDLGVVAQVSDDVAVMYLGKIVEKGDVKTIMRKPRHPYTQGLLQSLPGLAKTQDRLTSIEGSVPALTDIPTGCAFHPRCPHAKEGVCNVDRAPELNNITVSHAVACFRWEEIQPPSYEGESK
jgi:oligopeptide/dipeptide ABC transporter ATP-binding protein